MEVERSWNEFLQGDLDPWASISQGPRWGSGPVEVAHIVEEVMTALEVFLIREPSCMRVARNGKECSFQEFQRWYQARALEVWKMSLRPAAHNALHALQKLERKLSLH